MKLEEIRAAEQRLLLSTYDRSPVLFVDGEGVYIQDENGTKYLDLLSGIGVNALGYNHPAIVDTIARQSRALIHTSNLYYHEGQAELAMRLTERTGLDRVVLRQYGHRSLGGRAQVGARLRGPAPQRRRTNRHQVSRPRAELPRPHFWRHVHHLQGKVPRAVRARGSGRRVRALQRCCRPPCQVFQRSLRHPRRSHSRRGRRASADAGVFRRSARTGQLNRRVAHRR